MTTQQSVHLMLHYPLVRTTCTQTLPHTQGYRITRWSDCDKLHTVGGTMLFEGGLNCKTARATGSLLTWNGAQKTKHPKIYSRRCVTFPVCVWSRTNWPPTWPEWQQALTDGPICMCLPTIKCAGGSLTAAPCGPGGPGMPAWPGAPCKREKRRSRINPHLSLRFKGPAWKI